MNVSLTNELESFVDRLVASGMYHSASEVVRDGLRLLREQDEIRRLRYEELRSELLAGYEQAERGESKPIDLVEIKKEGRERMRVGAKKV